MPEFYNERINPMHQFLTDPDDGSILGVKNPHAGGLDFLPANERDFPRPNGRVFYVDFRTAANGGKGSNANSGRSWRAPYSTMAKAISVVEDFDTIVFIGTCTEANLRTRSGKEGVRIIGGGAHPSVGAMWKPSSGPALDLKDKGWELANFKVEPTGGQTMFRAYQDGTHNGSDFVLRNLENNGGAIFLHFIGAPDNWHVIGCRLHDLSDHAIKNDDISHSKALRGYIGYCRFYNNTNHVLAKLSDSEVEYCSFQAQGDSRTATTKLDLRGASAGRNLVHHNFVGGTFTIAGGYAAGTSDEWSNNYNEGGLRHGVPA